MKPAGTLAIVARDVGGLQIIVALGMVASASVALACGEAHTALGLAAASLLTGGVGLALHRTLAGAGEPGRREALVVAGAGWLAAAAFGALPYLFTAHLTPPEAMEAFVPAGADYTSSLTYFRNPLHAFFESMSGYTTTGLTMAVHEPSIGRGLLFYRSLTQWMGGAGVIVLSLAILPRPRAVSGLELYLSESSGVKLRPSVLGTARAIWKLYAGLTLLVAVWLALAILVVLPEYGLAAALFDAVNHAFAAQSTGGFSTLDDSIAGYGSAVLEAVHIPPMLLGSVSLPLYYVALQERSLRVFGRDPQFRTMLVVLGILTPLLIVLLVGASAVRWPLREGIFQAISAASTTGWQTSSIGDWPDPAVVVAVCAMVIGGAAGATVGGIKLMRVYLLARGAEWRVRAVFRPTGAVVPARVGDRAVPLAEARREIADAAAFTFLYMAVLVVGVLVTARFMGPEFTLGDALFESASAQGTVGLSAGITDPSMHVGIEVAFLVQMWMGRLEIFPVLVLAASLWSWAARRN